MRAKGWSNVWAGLVVFVAMTLAAAGAAEAETRVALVVANSDYAKAPLANPVVDAALVTPALQSMGFTVTTVENADLATFDEAINDFTEAARGADVALFYFAGHGFALNSGIDVQSYLMSTSADVTSKSDRVIISGGIPLDVIASQLTSAAKTTLIFVDACRNDPRVRASGNTGRGLAPVGDYIRGDIFIGLSTRIGDTADDGVPGEGSPFARAFVENMTLPGLSVDRAFNKVRLQVQEETKSQRPEAERADLSDPDGVVLMAAASPLPDEPKLDKGGIGPADITEAARQDWLLIQDMTSPGIFRTFAETYEGTIYARYALARIEELGGAPSKPKEVTPVPAEELVIPRDEAGRVLVADIDFGPVVPGYTTKSQLPNAGKHTLNIAKAPVHECDELAAHPVEHVGGVDGVVRLVLSTLPDALAACEAAVAEYPDEPRFLYQLARVKNEMLKRGEGADLCAKAVEMGLSLAMAECNEPKYGSSTAEAETYTEWNEKAAVLGSPTGLRNLSRMYLQGLGVEQDYNYALTLEQKAAAAGDLESLYGLAMTPLTSFDPADDAEGLRLLIAASDAGARPANRYLVNELSDPKPGIFQSMDERERHALYARSFLRLAATGSRYAASQSIDDGQIEAGGKRAVEILLAELGLYDGPTNGEFGPEVIAAINRIGDDPTPETIAAIDAVDLAALARKL